MQILDNPSQWKLLIILVTLAGWGSYYYGTHIHIWERTTSSLSNQTAQVMKNYNRHLKQDTASQLIQTVSINHSKLSQTYCTWDLFYFLS
jgi:hypothetical protein